MTKWIDYSGLRPNLHEVKAAGAVGVLRYLSEPIDSTSWKRITVAEKNAILAAGLDLILNWEWYEGRMLEGAPAGAHDGAEAARQAKALGYPKGATIYFSHDTGARDDNAIHAYMVAAKRAMGGYYDADIYSGYGTVQAMKRMGVSSYGWQTLAWSYGQVGSAHLYQNGKMWFSGQADENEQRNAPHGSWLQTLRQNPVVKPSPRPTHPAVPVVTHDYVVVKGDTLTHIAQSHHTTVKELLRMNPRFRQNPNMLKVGNKIVMPGAVTPDPAPRVTRYRIVRGDTLSSIAARYKTTVHQLMLLNKGNIHSANVIRVGQIIRVA